MTNLISVVITPEEIEARKKILRDNIEKIISSHLEEGSAFIEDEQLMEKVRDSLHAGKLEEARIWLKIYSDKEREIYSEYIEPSDENGLESAMYISDMRFQAKEIKKIAEKTYIDYIEDGLRYFQIAKKILEDGRTRDEVYIQYTAVRFLECLQHKIAGVDDPAEKALIAKNYLADVISCHLLPEMVKRLDGTSDTIWQDMLRLEKEFTDALSDIPRVALLAGEDNSKVDESAPLLQNNNLNEVGKARVFVKLPQNLSTIEKWAYENISNIRKWSEKPKLPSSTSFPTFFQRVAAFFSPRVPLPEGNIKRTAPGWITYLASPILYTLTLGQFSLFNRYTEKTYKSEVQQLEEQMNSSQSNKKIAQAYREYNQNPQNNETFTQFVSTCGSHIATKKIVDELLPANKDKPEIEKIPALLTVSKKMQEFFDRVASVELDAYSEEEKPSIEQLLQRSKETIQKIRNDVLAELAESLESLKKDLSFNSLKTTEKISYLTEKVMRRLSELKLLVEREIDNQTQYKSLRPLLIKTGEIIDTTRAKILIELNEYIKKLETDTEFEQMPVLEKNLYLTELKNCKGIDSQSLEKLMPKVEYTVEAVSRALKDWVSDQTIKNQDMLIHILSKYVAPIYSDYANRGYDADEINERLVQTLKPVIKEIIKDSSVSRFYCESHKLKLRFLERNPETQILSDEKYAEKRVILLLEDILKSELTPPEHLKTLNQDIERNKEEIMLLLQKKDQQIEVLKAEIKSIEKSLEKTDDTQIQEANREALQQDKKEKLQKISLILEEGRPLKNLLAKEIKGIQSLLTSEYSLHGDDEHYHKCLKQIEMEIQNSREMAPSKDAEVSKYRNAMDTILESIQNASLNPVSLSGSHSAESFFRNGSHVAPSDSSGAHQLNTPHF